MTTTTETPASCPPSAVHDMIVTWAEVREGDLIVWEGEFQLVERNWIWQGPGVRLIKLAGVGEVGAPPVAPPVGTYAAVRRYDVDEG